MNTRPTIVSHYRVVRNAWYGPETVTTWSHHPPILEVDQGINRSLLGHRYRFRRHAWTCLTDEYARLDVWLPLRILDLTNGAWWATLRFAYRLGMIHSNQPPAYVTRFRNIRLGRDHDR